MYPARLSRRLAGVALIAGAIAFAGGALAHEGVKHATPAQTKLHVEALEHTAGFPEIKSGDFKLVDQNGSARTSRDPDGHYQLVFFGYANCPAICSVVLPRMASAVDLLAGKKTTVTPVLITVDPNRDTIARLKPAVARIHPRLVGLTGSEAALDVAYKAFQVKKALVFESEEHGEIFSHGSFIYLLGPDGAFKTLLPPILSAQRIADVVGGYIARGEKTR